MSNRPLNIWPLLGTRVYAVRRGDTVGGCVVAAEYTGTPPSQTAGKPEFSAANWPMLGVVSSIQPWIEANSHTRTLSNPDATLEDEVKKVIKAAGLDITLDDLNDIAFEQAFGLAKLTGGTEQIPFSVNDSVFTGWLVFEAQDADGTGDNVIVGHLWCELRLKDMPKFGPKDRPGCNLRAQKKYSTLNTIEINQPS